MSEMDSDITELMNRTKKANQRALADYHNSKSPHYYDNERYSWAINQISRKHTEQLEEINIKYKTVKTQPL